MPTHLPRVNVVVTEEQHALLSELRRLDPSIRSSASFLRTLLDQVTPLLRKTVPLMRAAAEELDTSRESLREPLREFMAELHQLDLLDSGASERPNRSGARTDAPKRRSRRK